MSNKAKGGKSPQMPTLELIGTGKPKDTSAATKLEEIDIQQLTAVSGPIHRRVNALKNEQLKLLELESKFFEELHELESKYAKLYDPVYEKRRKIITGEYEPNEEESKWFLDEADEAEAKSDEKAAITNGEEGGDAATPKKDATTPAIDESKLTESGKKLLNDLKEQFNIKKGATDSDEKGIPNFWLETLQSFRITSELIQEYDEPVLAFLQDIRVRFFNEKPQGYALDFEFSENPYFTNKILTKTYYLKTEIDRKDPFSFEGPDLDKAIGCKIDWKANKNVTVKLIKKKLKPRNKKAMPKIITKEEKQDSFFNFFDTPKQVAKDDNSKTATSASDSDKQVAVKTDIHPDEDDEDEEDEIDSQLYLMADFEAGQYIKDKIVPKAVLYYCGELDDADEEDDYDEHDYDEDDLDDEDDDDDDKDDDDEEDDEEEDDDDEDDDDEGGKGGKGGKGGPKGGANKKHQSHHHHGGKPGGAGAKGSHGKAGEPTPSECKQN